MNWTDRLSEYLDGELEHAEAGALEEALRADPELRSILDDLKVVREAARTRPDDEAPGSLWNGVLARIAPDGAQAALVRPARRRFGRQLMFTVPQFAAAAGILLLLGVSVGRMSDRAPETPPVTVAVPETAPVANYATFVADLEARLEAGRASMDPQTARVIEQSLLKIDAAIAQARSALYDDPNNTYLNQHLASARARKLRLLEDATALVPPTT